MLNTTDPTLIPPPGPEPGANGLLREGQQIELLAGHLKKDDKAAGTVGGVGGGGGGGMIFVFDPRETPAYPPMPVIPSARLAAMEDAAGFTQGRIPNDMTFRIDAEVTEYRGRNYLYIQPSAIPVPPPSTAPSSAPATSPAAPLVNAVAPNPPPAALLTERSVVTNRIGRLVRDPRTGAKLIAFDADGTRLADPPMGVIPCKYLAILEDATDDGNKPLMFHVSGEVTTYRGKNYLYLKYVTVMRDLDKGIGAGTNVGG